VAAVCVVCGVCGVCDVCGVWCVWCVCVREMCLPYTGEAQGDDESDVAGYDLLRPAGPRAELIPLVEFGFALEGFGADGDSAQEVLCACTTSQEAVRIRECLHELGLLWAVAIRHARGGPCPTPQPGGGPGRRSWRCVAARVGRWPVGSEPHTSKSKSNRAASWDPDVQLKGFAPSRVECLADVACLLLLLAKQQHAVRIRKA
jgi:hypothetical protein